VVFEAVWLKSVLAIKKEGLLLVVLNCLKESQESVTMLARNLSRIWVWWPLLVIQGSQEVNETLSQKPKYKQKG
jgi:hypothetical protein